MLVTPPLLGVRGPFRLSWASTERSPIHLRHSNFHDSAKIQALADLLSNLSPLAVALSGGVDSSLLLHEAHQVLGDRVVAALAAMPAAN